MPLCLQQAQDIVVENAAFDIPVPCCLDSSAAGTLEIARTAAAKHLQPLRVSWVERALRILFEGKGGGEPRSNHLGFRVWG